MKLNALVLPVTAAVLLTLGAPAFAECPTEGCPAQSVGTIEVPAEGALVSGYVRVAGFALNGNLVSNVDLYVDGTDEANRVTPAGGANINLPRPDVTQAFPQYAGTPGEAPGFEMSFRAANYSNGTHKLYVRITDVTGCCYFLAPAHDPDRQRAEPAAVRRPRRSRSPTPPSTQRRPRGRRLGARRPARRARRRLHRRAPRARSGPRRQPPRRRRLLPERPRRDRLRLPDLHRRDAPHERRPHAHREGDGRPGAAGAPRRPGASRSFPNAPNLPPFGEVEHPARSRRPGSGTASASPAVLRAARSATRGTSCSSPGGRSTPRSTRSAGGVSHVFLELDGVVLKDTRGAFGTLGCRREFNLNNALVDCYGFYRPDVNIFYPGFPQSANSGFFFAVDVGYLLTDKGFKEGNHMLQVKAADKEDNVTLLKEVPVHLECATQNLDPSPLGYVDDPSNYEFVGGIFPVLGWALDLDTVIRVRVLIDGVPQVDAVTGHDYAEYGLPSPDVAAVYPNYPQRTNARWRFYLDTTKIANSEHDLLVEVIDGRGNYRSAGTRRFIVNNNTLRPLTLSFLRP